jgi:hypothetical protein
MLRQEKKMVAVRLAKVSLVELNAFLPKFRKAAGDAATLSDLMRVGLDFAMKHRDELVAELKGKA